MFDLEWPTEVFPQIEVGPLEDQRSYFIYCSTFPHTISHSNTDGYRLNLNIVDIHLICSVGPRYNTLWIVAEGKLSCLWCVFTMYGHKSWVLTYWVIASYTRDSLGSKTLSSWCRHVLRGFWWQYEIRGYWISERFVQTLWLE